MLFVIAMLPSLLFIPFDPVASASGPGGHGCKEGNLIPNCGMEQFAPVPQGQAPAGWTPFVLSGSLAMDRSPDTYWGAPSLRMWSDGGTFDGRDLHPGWRPDTRRHLLCLDGLGALHGAERLLQPPSRH